MSDKRVTALRPHGHTFAMGPDSTIEADTLSCVHCGRHWPITGKQLTAFCGNCNGPICGPGCMECVPLEKQLEIWEGVRNPTAVSVAVTGLILP